MKFYRFCINIVDDLLVFLLNCRFSIVLKIGQYKKKHNIAVLDSSRETSLLGRLSKKEKYRNMVKSIWLSILDFSKNLQK